MGFIDRAAWMRSIEEVEEYPEYERQAVKTVCGFSQYDVEGTLELLQILGLESRVREVVDGM